MTGSGRKKRSKRGKSYLAQVRVTVSACYLIGHLAPAGYANRPVVGVDASSRTREAEAQREEDAQRAQAPQSPVHDHVYSPRPLFSLDSRLRKTAKLGLAAKQGFS